MVWQSYERRPQAYGFTYDAYGRLKKAEHADRQATGWHSGNRSGAEYWYDGDGNLKLLRRQGVLDNPYGGVDCFGQIDNIRYWYAGGRMTKVRDYSGQQAGRKGTTSTMSYSVAGELLSDPGAGYQVEFDAYSLPKRISLTGGGQIELGYDASGTKHYQQVNSDEVQYFAGIEVRNGQPYAVSHAHGRLLLNGSEGGPEYEYVIRDHLGSSRVVLKDRYFDHRDVQAGFTEEPGLPFGSSYFGVTTGGSPAFSTLGLGGGTYTIPVVRIVQVNDYYPFGLNHETQVPQAQQGNDYQYGYTGQELVGPEVGLTLQDYSARWYDAGLGRFTTVDPLADMYSEQSPYNYVLNNPISNTDPTGRSVNGEYELDDNNEWQKTSTVGDEIGVDFYHFDLENLDGSTRQTTYVTDREGNWNTITGGRVALSGQLRGSKAGWADIYNEFSNGSGPERSIFEGTHPANLDIQRHYLYLEQLSQFEASGESKRASVSGFNLFSILRTGENMQAQMMGNFNISFYKLGDKTLSLAQDSKSRYSLYYHLPVTNFARSDTQFQIVRGGNHFYGRSSNIIIPHQRESNTYQSYIFFNGQ